MLTRCEQAQRAEMMRAFLGSLRALLEGDHDRSLAATERCIAHFRDPEVLYYMARQLAVLAKPDRALAVLEHVTDRGYSCSTGFARDPWLRPLASLPAFDALLQRTVRLERETASAFVEAGGNRVLELPDGV